MDELSHSCDSSLVMCPTKQEIGVRNVIKVANRSAFHPIVISANKVVFSTHSSL